MGDLAGAIGIRAQESAIVAELKAGSEDAYAWLIGEFHQPIYSLVYRIVTDPADAADTTQEVFLKVFRGMKHFHGESSLKTWIYRIAVHEASNRRRWWFRHKAQESSIEPASDDSGLTASGMRDTLVDESESPFDSVVHEEVRARVEEELRQISEPYRTSVILRDLEDMSYEEIAEITQVSLGTVKSRLTRGREALRRRLTTYVMENGQQLGLRVPEESNAQEEIEGGCAVPVDRGGAMTCAQAKPLFSPYLDGAVTGRQMRDLGGHLESCDRCRQHYVSLRRTQQLLTRVGPRKAPPDLALNLRVAISQEAAQSRRRYMDGARDTLTECAQRIHGAGDGRPDCGGSDLRRADGLSGALAGG